ncbi:MAG: aminotransferase class V-fold PLP-dependent enzyme [Bacteroidetes bacterium]|nr:aminotransferase class V-fold PLP-dependent enzyme [Bacteroidota bacterium]
MNKTEAFAELERGVHAALETYSNVHRGSGHNSMVSTHLFEQAREIILEYLGLDKSRYIVIFCTPARAAALTAQLDPESYHSLSSRDIGLPLGLRALAVRKKALPKGTPFQTGGGTTKLIAPGWVMWAGAPDRFEAGTPAIINIIAFAKALQMIRPYGQDIFKDLNAETEEAGEILFHNELEKYAGRELLDELRQTHIGRNVNVPTMEGAIPYINLDNAASTPTFTSVWNAVCQTWRQPERVQKEIIHEVRSICAGALGAPPDAYDLIFTSNTTEAINLVAESIGREPDQDTEPVLLSTLLEHSSNDLPWRMVPRHSLIRLSIDDDGVIDLKELDSLLNAYNKESVYGKKRIKLVAVSGCSNVLGIYNDLMEVSRIVHQYGARLLVDAAQLIAHRKAEMEKCGIDYLAFSAHKVYAPFGCGVLVVKKGLLNSNSTELELIQTSGEENAGGIAALGKALVLLQRIGMDVIRGEEQALTRRALLGLAQIPGLRMYGIKDPDSERFAQKGGVIVFSLKGIMPDRLAGELAMRGGIGVRYGCHCAHLLVKHILHVGHGLESFQHILLTFFPMINLPGILRVSIGIENREAEVDTLINVLDKIARKKETSEDRRSASDNNETPLLPRTVVKQQMKDFVRDAAMNVYSIPADILKSQQQST